MGEIPIALPLVAGHEGAGVVEAVGPGVTKVEKGDHVGVTWMIPCGKCPQCLRGKGNICSGNFPAFLEGMLLDGTSRIKDNDGNMVRHGNFVSCFSTHSTHIDIPRLVDLASTGTLKLDKLVTNKFKLDEINDVAIAMEKREIEGRWVCEID